MLLSAAVKLPAARGATPPSPVRLHKKINPETGQVQNYNLISCVLGQPVSRCAILHDVLHAVHKNPRCKARTSGVVQQLLQQDTPPSSVPH